MLVGLGVFLLIGVGGAALDLGRQELMHMRLQHATDAAALSAGSLRDTLSARVTNPMRVEAARRYYMLSMPATYFGIARPAANITITGNTIRVATEAVPVPTLFIKLLGISTLSTWGVTEFTFPSPDVKMDVILMVATGEVSDSTVREGGRRLDVTRAKTVELAKNILEGSPNNRVALVIYDSQAYRSLPFTNSVGTITSELSAMSTRYDGRTWSHNENTTKALNFVYDTPWLKTGYRTDRDVVRNVIIINHDFNTPNNQNVFNRLLGIRFRGKVLDNVHDGEWLCDALVREQNIHIYTVFFGNATSMWPGLGGLFTPGSPHQTHIDFMRGCASDPQNYYYVDGLNQPATPQMYRTLNSIVNKIRSTRFF